MPWLAGPRGEVLAAGGPMQEDEGFFLTESHGSLAGVAVADPAEDPYAAALRLYSGALARLGGSQLYRVWNYVPQINHENNGLENYRAFNAGRHQAFLAAYGQEFAHRLPAASALGTTGDRLAVCFLAGPGPARHVENPTQVPAFQYPAEHGPTPPSFARGTTVSHSGGRTWYLSGTASIKGHASCGASLAGQARLTFDNVRLMFQHMDLPPGASGPWKVFLRHRHDLAPAMDAFHKTFPEAADQAIFLEADICRSSLLLEVEATLHQSAVPQHADPAPILSL